MPEIKRHRTVIISATAQKNFERIIQQTEENFGKKISLKLILRFEKFINLIEYYPYLFGFYLKSKNIRKFILTKSHLILYKPKRDEIEIIAIVYQKQHKISFGKKK